VSKIPVSLQTATTMISSAFSGTTAVATMNVACVQSGAYSETDTTVLAEENEARDN